MHTQIFLSAPAPFPETMIASNPMYYYEYTMMGWTGSAVKKNGGIPEWVKDGVEPYLDGEKGKDRIAAACEDVRQAVYLCLSRLLSPISVQGWRYIRH